MQYYSLKQHAEFKNVFILATESDWKGGHDLPVGISDLYCETDVCDRVCLSVCSTACSAVSHVSYELVIFH